MKRMMQIRVCRCVAALIFTTTLSGFLGCDREERQFRVAPPYASRSNTIVMSHLQPGVKLADPSTPNAYDENAYAINEGHRLYIWYNCNGCHASGGGDIGPTLMDDKWIYGSDPANIYATILQGRPNGMPSFRGKIPDFQVWQLVAYVRSLSANVPRDAAPARDDHMKLRQDPQMTERKNPKASSFPKSAERTQ